jgi:hypothetical protein
MEISNSSYDMGHVFPGKCNAENSILGLKYLSIRGLSQLPSQQRDEFNKF